LKKDREYGGVFFTKKAALRAAKNGGCPPIEIMMPYLNGNEFSFYSRVKISGIREKIEIHISNCSDCKYFMENMRKYASTKELN